MQGRALAPTPGYTTAYSLQDTGYRIQDAWGWEVHQGDQALTKGEMEVQHWSTPVL